MPTKLEFSINGVLSKATKNNLLSMILIFLFVLYFRMLSPMATSIKLEFSLKIGSLCC